MISFPYSGGKTTCYSDKLHYFSVNIRRCYKHVFVSFFPFSASPWSSLLEKCFPLIYDLNEFKSRIIRRLLYLGSF